MKTTYIVSGYMRSGTSMMMKALHMGGLEPEFHPSRDRLNDCWGDELYKPNANGFYELTNTQYNEIDFPKQYMGKLIKVLFGGIPSLYPGDYKIVVMVRDQEEIRQSYEAFFDQPTPININKYHSLVEKITGIMNMRTDMSYQIVNYEEAVKNPFSIFKKLEEEGWPIDPEKAAQVINPEHYRFRREILNEGI